MAKTRKSSRATDKGQTQADAADDAKTNLSEAVADAVVTDDVDDAPEPTDPLNRARTEMEEVIEGQPAEAQADITETITPEPEPTDPLDRAESEMEEVSEGLAATVAHDPEPGPEPDAREASAGSDDPVAGAGVTEPAVAASTAALVPQPTTKVVQGSIWPGFFGGVIAALIGFIVGRSDMIDAYLPAALQRSDVDTSAIEAEAAALSARTAELAALTEEQGARLAALETADTGAADAAALTEALSGIEGRMEEIAGRLGELESRPVATVVDDTAATEAVAELQAALEAQNAQIAELAEKADAAEAAAAGEAARLLARAALLRVQSAVDSGESFAPALTELEDVAPVEVPDPLRAAAEVGVPTMASLQDSFPDAARAGLAAARAEIPESEVEGIAGFLRRQLNARSLSPREGSDPDAVLSRAQAAVRAGDLATALGEMEALPDSARAAMSDWLDAASARKVAQDAANDLADSLNSN